MVGFLENIFHPYSTLIPIAFISRRIAQWTRERKQSTSTKYKFPTLSIIIFPALLYSKHSYFPNIVKRALCALFEPKLMGVGVKLKII